MILIGRSIDANGEKIDFIKGKYHYCGRILRPESVKLLKETGKTVLPEIVYKTFSEQEIIEELNDITGEDCGIEVIRHYEEEELAKKVGITPQSQPTYLVYRKPHYWFEEKGNVFRFYNYNEIVEEISRNEIVEHFEYAIRKNRGNTNSISLSNIAKIIFRERHKGCGEIRTGRW